VASAMGDEDEVKADQGYGAILDREGDVGRVNMRIPFQLGLSVALQREQTRTGPRCRQAETP
jgi:hypothetical protein